MKIEKIYQTEIDKSKVMAEKVESDINTYSCNYVNEQLDNMVEDTLTSTSTINALSAAQGKALNDGKLGKSENAVSASSIVTRGRISMETGKTALPRGITFQNCYNGGYPSQFGNVLNIYGEGESQLLMGWEGGNITSSTSQQRGRLYYRSLRDYTADNTVWSSWGQIFTGVSLYDNSTGSTGTITLNENASYFSFMDIYIKTTYNNDIHCYRIYSPNGKKTVLHYIEGPRSSSFSIDNVYEFWRGITISGTSISTTEGCYGLASLSGSLRSYENRCAIIKVMGYR